MVQDASMACVMPKVGWGEHHSCSPQGKIHLGLFQYCFAGCFLKISLKIRPACGEKLMLILLQKKRRSVALLISGWHVVSISESPRHCPKTWLLLSTVLRIYQLLLYGSALQIPSLPPSSCSPLLSSSKKIQLFLGVCKESRGCLD